MLTNRLRRTRVMTSWFVSFIFYDVYVFITIHLMQPPEVNMLSELSISVPEIALESVVDAAGTCKKMLSPFYEYVGSTLSTDIEKVVKSLHEADPEFVDELVRDSFPCILVVQSAEWISPSRTRMKKYT